MKILKNILKALLRPLVRPLLERIKLIAQTKLAVLGKKPSLSIPLLDPYRIDLNFFSKSPQKDTKILFEKNVQYIILETHSFCNKQCWFCPNSFIDRHSKMHKMDENLYLKILKELSQIHYNGALSFAYYNEPLADKDFIRQVKIARDILPHVPLLINTNGDFLTAEKLEELYQAGMTSILISIYTDADSPGEYSYEKGIVMINNISKKLNISPTFVQGDNAITCEAFIWYKKSISHRGMYIFLHAENHLMTTNARGGSIHDHIPVRRVAERTQSCIAPFTQLMIQYDGKTTICSNIRPDYTEHAHFVTGDVNTDTIFDAFGGARATEFRLHILNDIATPPANLVPMSCFTIEEIFLYINNRKFFRLSNVD